MTDDEAASTFRLNVRVPTDATRVSEWLPTIDGPTYSRLFDGTHREAAGVRVHNGRAA